MKKVRIISPYLHIKETPKGQDNIVYRLYKKEGDLIEIKGDRAFVEIDGKIFNLPLRIIEDV